ncbi:hypothetical protein H2O64_16510 [Kordia sp. YSTF-M3]|uniref:HEPN AbiU2-like domain-containing protein n=1 Tax=Kordia aestuariivivens TaxID=2759037 RepID=A0ABR7QCZ4_9FLAO|nr:hypothetical protein [Kordia aestuariivivens]MBC8756278.1 hypothetical protein [Kordia aestuariivivens]
MKSWTKKVFSKKEKNNLGKTLEKAELIRLDDIDTTREIWNVLQKSGINNYDEFYNVCLYSSIVYNDISILFDNYQTSNSETQVNLFGRLLCMTIIEFLDDINPLIGNSLRKELESNDMPEFIDELKEIGREFALLKRENNIELRMIRNNSAAHKTKKAKDLIDFTKETPFKNLDELATKISVTNNKLTNLTTKIIVKITEIISLKFENINNKKS